MFHGSMVALVTPMRNGEVDYTDLESLIEYHIENGTQALVVAGTTGESGTLSYEEKIKLIKTSVELVANRIPVIAGTGCNGTHACQQLSEQAMHAGVHAVLVMTPAYIRPTQEGLVRHYTSIAKNIGLPIILYNVPARTACDMLPKTVEKLSHVSNIVGIKEAVAEPSRLDALLEACADRIDIYSGDDASSADWMLSGAKGCISVTANIAPALLASMCNFALDKQKEQCLSVQEQLMPLHRLMGIESNPIPVKWAMARMGLLCDDIRLPLTPLSLEHRDAVEQVLHSLELL